MNVHCEQSTSEGEGPKTYNIHRLAKCKVAITEERLQQGSPGVDWDHYYS